LSIFIFAPHSRQAMASALTEERTETAGSRFSSTGGRLTKASQRGIDRLDQHGQLVSRNGIVADMGGNNIGSQRQQRFIGHGNNVLIHSVTTPA
jgi:hypothetical protein